MKVKLASKIGKSAVKIASHGKYWATKNAPTILIGVGTVGFAGTCAAIVKGTFKTKDNLDEYHAVVAALKDGSIANVADITEKECKIAFAKETAIAYAPAAALGIGTLACFLGAHNILKSRNIKIAVAYSALDAGFKKYRSNVVEKYGEDEDRRLKNNIKVRQETITEVGEDGKKHKKKVDVEYIDEDVDMSPYCYIFDDKHSMASVKDPVIARDMLLMAENSANQLLNGRGYITLNEVLRSIGLHETSAGQIVGWQKKGNGDGYVDFNVTQVRTAMDEEGVAFLLDFNVDGPIYQDIDKYTKLWEE